MSYTAQVGVAQQINYAVVDAVTRQLLQGFHIPALPALRMTCVEWVKSHEGLVEAVYERTSFLDPSVLGRVVAAGNGANYEELVMVGLDALCATSNDVVRQEFYDPHDGSGQALLRRHATMATLSFNYRRCQDAVRLGEMVTES